MKQKIIATSFMFLLTTSALAQNDLTPQIAAEPLIPVSAENMPAEQTPLVPTGENVAPSPDTAATPDVDNIRSMLFSPGDIQTIRSARSFYEQTIKGVEKGKFSEDDFLKKLEKVTIQKLDTIPQSFTYPQFFLSSIAYQSKEDWVVWVNSEKITQDSVVTPSGLLISNIEPGKVTFEWLPTRMDKISDNIEPSEENPVKVDFARKKVQFTLKTNQTFTSYAMRVVEGKVPPVTIDNSKGGIAAPK